MAGKNMLAQLSYVELAPPALAVCRKKGEASGAPTVGTGGFIFASLAETRHYQFRKPRFAVIVRRHCRPLHYYLINVLMRLTQFAFRLADLFDEN
jgi:hypothetical protein